MVISYALGGKQSPKKRTKTRTTRTTSTRITKTTTTTRTRTRARTRWIQQCDSSKALHSNRAKSVRIEELWIIPVLGVAMQGIDGNNKVRVGRVPSIANLIG
jgi:hypothetical protein